MIKLIHILFLLAVPHFVNASSLPTYPFIHANGVSTLSIAPDIAELDFDIRSLAATPQESKQQLEEASQEIVAFLASNHIDRSAIDAYDTKKIVSEDETSANEKTPVRYRLLRSFHFFVKDLNQWVTITDFLLNKAYIGNLSATFGRSDLDNIHRQLVLGAINNAKDNAKTMANGLTVKLGSATAISESPLAKLGGVIGLASSAMTYVSNADQENTERGERTNLAIPGALRYKKTVDVIFKIKQ